MHTARAERRLLWISQVDMRLEITVMFSPWQMKDSTVLESNGMNVSLRRCQTLRVTPEIPLQEVRHGAAVGFFFFLICIFEVSFKCIHKRINFYKQRYCLSLQRVSASKDSVFFSSFFGTKNYN